MASSASPGPEQFLSELLDGQAGISLRDTIPLQVRKEGGAFFSSSVLRSAAFATWPPGIETPRPVLDPTVGAGDLLIEYAKRLPVHNDLAQTLRQWGPLLHGRDVEPAFVRLTKARLVLLAASQGATGKSDNAPKLDKVLPEIRIGDGLDLLNSGWSGGQVVMNPPFTYCNAPEGAKWARGRTSLAATFLATAVEHMQHGSCLIAILPDVIRSGSRYDRLRTHVAGRLNISATEAYGRFDAWTDIDVFILRGVVVDDKSSSSPALWWRQTAGEKLGDRFVVCVGNVVPHRDPESDHTKPYLHARTIPLGGDFDVSDARRRGFQTRTFTPPFIVIRRTSRPGDKSRAIGTMVLGTEDVLVENHLIVLKPKDGSISACRDVTDLLASAQAKQWLDERIRCRHLTVQALRELPWFSL